MCMKVLAIRFYREKAGLTREELAKRVNISEAELKAYEGGFESPTLDKAMAIATELGVTMYDLAKGAWDK